MLCNKGIIIEGIVYFQIYFQMSDGTDDFTVEMDHENCGEFLDRNCPSGVTVQYKTTKVILQKSKDVLVTEDSSTVKLVTLPYLSRDVQVKHITSTFIEVKVLGASILWDSDSQVSIRLEPTYSGMVCMFVLMGNLSILSAVWDFSILQLNTVLLTTNIILYIIHI